MRERYCFEYGVYRHNYDDGRFGPIIDAYAIIDRRQGLSDPLGYILEAGLAQRIVDALNKEVSDDERSENRVQ